MMWKISPSQFKKYRMCKRMFGFEYVEGLFPPSTDKQTFGSAVHKVLEGWLKEGTPPDSNTQEGAIAKQGIRGGWLPTPSPNLLVEHEFLLQMDADIYTYGFIDCVVPGTIPMVIDHKTTSDLRWAMTEGELGADPQALLYALWAMFHFNVPKVTARWIYYAATNPEKGIRKPRGAKPIEFVFDSASGYFIEQIRQIVLDMRDIVHIRENKLPGITHKPNPDACSAYGGCPHAEKCNLSSSERIDSYF